MRGSCQALAGAFAFPDRRTRAARLDAAKKADTSRTGRRDRPLEADGGRERTPADRNRLGGGHRPANSRRPRPRPGGLVLRPGRRHRRGARRQHRAGGHRGRVRRRLRRHGVAGRSDDQPAGPAGRRRHRLADRSRRRTAWRRTDPAPGGGKRRRPGRPPHRQADPSTGRTVPARRTRSHRGAWRRTSADRSPSTTT